jgi:hypothetical protein
MNASSARTKTRPSTETPAEPASPEPAADSASTNPTGLPPASVEAKRLATVILEVLGGARGPSEAAQVLGISLCRYYQLENRAIAGLLGACEPRRRGRGSSGPVNELASLRQECQRLRRDCARQQALVRAAQRTVGLAPPAVEEPPASTGSSKKRRKRRPTARALKMAAMLKDEPTPAVSSEAESSALTPVPAGTSTSDS